MSFEYRFQGLAAIAVVAIGQLVSLIGTGMTSFAVIIWVYQKTGRAMDITLLSACSFGSLFLLTPLAGALVDRWDRKRVMMVSDVGSGIASITILALLTTDRLDIVPLYFIMAFSGAFRAFQVPAYGAATTMMVEKKQYARVSGILSLPYSSSLIAAPIVAGALIGPIGLGGILVVDIVSFLFAVTSLALIHVPPPPSRTGEGGPTSLVDDMLFGWHFVRQKKPLLKLMTTLFCFNFTLMLPISLLPPLVLARTDSNELILGTVQSLLGLGSLAGAVVLSVWGGPRRRADGVLLGMLWMSLMTGVMMGLSQVPWGWYLAAFFGSLTMPVIAGCAQAIWQIKVPPDIQGRVFGIRRVLSQGSSLPAFLLAGPLADKVFEPALMPGGAWAPLFGPIVGTGSGAGVSLIFVISGLLGIAAGIGAYAAGVWRIEDQMPDHNVQAGIPFSPDNPSGPDLLHNDDSDAESHCRTTS